MARFPRLVVPGYPHHVTQRGNRKQRTFFRATDYRRYIALVASALPNAEIEILAYCLMPNHVHFVLVPHREDSLVRLFKEAHRRYTREINLRMQWQGHLWQERFHSSVMDEIHFLAAVRYVELNPVKAGLCDAPAAWPWSSASAHLHRTHDPLINSSPVLRLVSNWSAFLKAPDTENRNQRIKNHTSTGRPLGNEAFVEKLEKETGRKLSKKKRGRKRKSKLSPN